MTRPTTYRRHRDADQMACAMWELEEQRDALLAALREAEWGARNSWDDPACPVCVNTKTQGHFVHCAVGKVLAAAEPFDERTNLTCREGRHGLRKDQARVL